MTNSRMVPVGKHNPTVFVRTDQVISMEITRRYAGGDEHQLTIYMDGMTPIVSFDSEYEAAEAAVLLCNKINGVD
jgi:hypothetical protein